MLWFSQEVSERMTEVLQPAVDDGRRVRRERNRDAVVDALLSLFRDGELAPSAEDVAARAGLSPRSLFRYFDDVDDLSRAAIARQLERVAPLLAAAPDSSAALDARIASFIELRLRLFDAMGAVGVVSRLRAPFHSAVAAELARGRAHLRQQIKDVFATELTGPRRASTL